jgi:hypothetical protein
MDMDFEEGGDFGSFEGILEALAKGGHHAMAPILRYRQGADPLDWGLPGAAKYLPGSWQMLVGAIKWTGAAATSGVVEWNFAQAFANNPILIASCYYTWPLHSEMRCLATPGGWSTGEVWWWSTVNLTQAAFMWLAIGPIGA